MSGGCLLAYCVNNQHVPCKNSTECFDIITAETNSSDPDWFFNVIFEREGYPLISCSADLDAGQTSGVCFCYTDYLLTGGTDCLDHTVLTYLNIGESAVTVVFGLILLIYMGLRIERVSFNLAALILSLLILMVLQSFIASLSVIILTTTYRFNIVLLSLMDIYADALFLGSNFCLGVIWWKIHSQTLSLETKRNGNKIMMLLATIFWIIFAAQTVFYVLAITEVTVNVSFSNNETTVEEKYGHLLNNINYLNSETFYGTYLALNAFALGYTAVVACVQGVLMTRALRVCVETQKYQMKVNFCSILKDAFICSYGSLDEEFDRYSSMTFATNAELIRQIYLVTRVIMVVFLCVLLSLVADWCSLMAEIGPYTFIQPFNLASNFLYDIRTLVYALSVFRYLYMSGCFSIVTQPVNGASIREEPLEDSELSDCGDHCGHKLVDNPGTSLYVSDEISSKEMISI